MEESPGPRLDRTLVKEIENKTQELYVATLTVDRLKANIDHLENENRDLQTQLSEEQQLRRDSQSLAASGCNGRSSVSQQQLSDVLQELDEARASQQTTSEENKILKKQVAELSELVSAASKADLSQSFSSGLEKEIIELKEQITLLEDEKTRLEEQLTESERELHRRMSRQNELEREMEEKEEEIQCLDSQFTSQCSINQRLREEMEELRSQLELETASTNPERKGNSLFSEVDDRRVAAEKRLVYVQRQLVDIEEKLTKEQKDNKRLKHQIAVLRQTSSKGSSAAEVRDLQTKLVESKRSILQLTQSLQQQQQQHSESSKPSTASCEIRTPNLDGYTDTDKQFINFLQGVLRQKEKEIKESKKEAQQKHVKVLSQELDLTQVKHDLLTLTHKFDQVKATNVQLSMELQELQKKFEPEKYDDSVKGKDKLPIFSGQGSNPSTLTRSPLKALDNDQNQTQDDKNLDNADSNKSSSKTKANDPFEAVSRILGDGEKGKSRSKSVRMAGDVDVISTEGSKVAAPLAEEGKGKKVKRHVNSSSTGKYKSLSVSAATPVDDEQVDCKQQ